jgi:putative transposase
MYPTEAQRASLESNFGSCRWLWNHCLEISQKTYRETGKSLSWIDLINLLPEMKKHEETSWLKETYSQALQMTCRNLSQAYINFFEKRAKYPRFKKKSSEQSIQFPQGVRIEGEKIQIPRIGKVRFVQDRTFEGKMKTVTVRKKPSGRYFVSILVDDGQPEPTPSTHGRVIGLDLGLTTFVATSEGSKFNKPNIKRYEQLLKRRQRHLARKRKGSKGRDKARIQVAKVYEKIQNVRKDFLHKLSTKLVNENQVLVFEDLNVKGMTQNHCLAKAIQDSSWSTFVTMCQYKARWTGKVVLKVDRWFPSSQLCHRCYHQQKLSLSDRFWTCSKCGERHDRDVNASINLREEGKRVMAGGEPVTADGRSVRPRGRRKFTKGQDRLKSET